MLRIYILVLAFVCGACAGSFVNCAADRYAAKQSIFRGRSHCPACGHALGVLDLFPVLSYLFLRGKCRHCGAPIPSRCLWTELLGGMFFFLAAWEFGFSFFTLEACLLFAALFALSLTDLDTMEIPDGIMAFCAVVFLCFLPAYADPLARLKQGVIGGAIYGGGMLALSLLLDFALGRESLGGGDVKLLFVLGLFLGPWKGLLMLILACLFGLAYHLLSTPKPGVDFSQKEFPFGPAIAFSAFVTTLVGQEIIDLYLTLIL